ncbi:MAG: hypothetical protein JRJ66_16000 [Deltaproteobacteria bacterium]|nr:hypothetical protein [Deltaproteobacteria bacterium]
MRSYIFTRREREALLHWFSGTLHRDQDTLLHTLLNRLTKNRQNLIQDIRLFTLAQRKLGRRRLRDRRTQITLAVAPIPVPVKPDRTVFLVQRLRHELEQANDPDKAPRQRLEAAAKAIETAQAMLGHDPRTLVAAKRKLREHQNPP